MKGTNAADDEDDDLEAKSDVVCASAVGVGVEVVVGGGSYFFDDN